jgi:hypothetical protein
MTLGELVISLLLGVIAYLLYHIAKQLSYLTRVKLSFRLPRWQNYRGLSAHKKKEEPKERLVN